MCFGDDARPPAPPVQGPVGAHGELILTAVDSNRFGAYFAHPAQPSERAIVILPDIRGLHNYYKDLAIRFAEAGYHCVAIDPFGRTAGIGARDESFDWKVHVDQIEVPTVNADVAAAITWLRGNTPLGTRIYSLGFCFGGALSWEQSASGNDLAGCIGFYGRPSLVAPYIPQMSTPLLLLAAGADHIPLSDVEDFAAKVREHGVEARMTVFPDAPHSFFDRTFEEHTHHCERAWQEIIDFAR